ncbi:phosphatidylglycerophosphatase A [soil metagenome]
MKPNITPPSVWTNPLHFVAFGFGSGALPFAPGTWGTVVAIPLYLAIRDLSLAYYLTILFVAIIAGIWLCDKVAKEVGVHDHSGIVWDEIVGYGVTMIAAPHEWQWIIIGFLLFRLFDIWKPWPIGWIDKHAPGGFGSVIDDIVAAIYAWLVLQGLAYLIQA